MLPVTSFLTLSQNKFLQCKTSEELLGKMHTFSTPINPKTTLLATFNQVIWETTNQLKAFLLITQSTTHYPLSYAADRSQNTNLSSDILSFANMLKGILQTLGFCINRQRNWSWISITCSLIIWDIECNISAKTMSITLLWKLSNQIFINFLKSFKMQRQLMKF